eukprot:2973213-Pyramimonas_sp.AAC.2
MPYAVPEGFPRDSSGFPRLPKDPFGIRFPRDSLRIPYGFLGDSVRIPEGFPKDSLRVLKDSFKIPLGLLRIL